MKLLIKNAKILPVDEAMSLIENGWIGIDGSVIAFVEKEETQVVLEFDADRVIDAKGKMVMPGFVNTHSHSPMTILRCFGDDLPLDEWLLGR